MTEEQELAAIQHFLHKVRSEDPGAAKGKRARTVQSRVMRNAPVVETASGIRPVLVRPAAPIVVEGPFSAEAIEAVTSDAPVKKTRKRAAKKSRKRIAKRTRRPSKKARKTRRRPAKKAARRGRPRTAAHYTTPMRKAHARELKAVRDGHAVAIGMLKQTSHNLEKLIADEEKAMKKLYRSAE